MLISIFDLILFVSAKWFSKCVIELLFYFVYVKHIDDISCFAFCYVEY